ncbi:MAG: hypothetical protein CMJ19_20220 [Phycisphaeraceae bacterium]|nr:hypothetical protein [Phycisphaeraceae bacterium]|tara:strand:- start:493 stop:702 length:210 start_codon:yes stop_codon:yes gene_type:complete
MNDRRNFLKRIGRLTLFSGLTIGGAHLVNQSKSESKRNDACKRDGYCRQCPLLKKCGTPIAISFKEAAK